MDIVTPGSYSAFILRIHVQQRSIFIKVWRRFCTGNTN